MSVLVFWWLKAAHNPAAAVEVAKAFVTHLEAKRFVQAYELTTKGGYAGTSVEQLEEIAHRQLCEVDRIVSTSPFQSNGNRLRRWSSGTEIEMPEVRVEFEGKCLLGVTIRHMPNKEWRVSKFASHAG